MGRWKLDRWVSGWMNEWMNGWKNGWMNDWMNEETILVNGGWVNNLRNVWIDERWIERNKWVGEIGTWVLKSIDCMDCLKKKDQA